MTAAWVDSARARCARRRRLLARVQRGSARPQGAPPGAPRPCRLGDAPRILAQQEAIGDALEAVLRGLPDELLRAPGGEEDWNVAQAFAHTTAARRFLATWASLDAGDGEWPEADPPRVTPSVPGRPDATRDELLVLLEKSRVAQRSAAERITGHERQRCRMDHPLVGHLRCGEWLVFVGIHDLMHLEQLHRLREARRGRCLSGPLRSSWSRCPARASRSGRMPPSRPRANDCWRPTSRGGWVARARPLRRCRPPSADGFHWGRWFTAAARQALDAAAGSVDAIGYAGGGALCLVADDALDALLSPIAGRGGGEQPLQRRCVRRRRRPAARRSTRLEELRLRQRRAASV